MEYLCALKTGGIGSATIPVYIKRVPDERMHGLFRGRRFGIDGSEFWNVKKKKREQAKGRLDFALKISTLISRGGNDR